MKLEVGMYVRTNNGDIGKIIAINTEKFSKPAYTLDIFSRSRRRFCTRRFYKGIR